MGDSLRIGKLEHRKAVACLRADRIEHRKEVACLGADRIEHRKEVTCFGTNTVERRNEAAGLRAYGTGQGIKTETTEIAITRTNRMAHREGAASLRIERRERKKKTAITRTYRMEHREEVASLRASNGREQRETEGRGKPAWYDTRF